MKYHGNGWTVLENDVYGTTYTHENAPTPYQFSYRVFAIAADGCNGSSSTFYNACNESNIMHVVSLPNAEIGAVNSSCNNSDLDDCGYFSSNFTFESLKLASGGSVSTSTLTDRLQDKHANECGRHTADYTHCKMGRGITIWLCFWRACCTWRD